MFKEIYGNPLPREKGRSLYQLFYGQYACQLEFDGQINPDNHYELAGQ
jgi:hypothetical protein